AFLPAPQKRLRSNSCRGNCGRHTKIPPAGAGGSFNSNLEAQISDPLPQSHQRELVDRSIPNLETHPSDLSQNPTSGSWWIIQFQPRCTRLRPLPKSHQRELVDHSIPT